MGALLAMVASVLYGAGDFVGAVSARRVDVVRVLAGGQAVAFVIVSGAVLVEGGAPSRQAAVVGCLSGFALVGALGAFFRATQVGAIGVVTPVSASGAVLPIAVGLIAGVPLTGIQTLGVALAVMGVALVSWDRSEIRPRPAAQGVGWALTSAVGVGAFILLIGLIGGQELYWGLWFQRAAALVLSIAWLSTVPRVRSLSPLEIAMICSVGLCDVSATMLLAHALEQAPLAIVAASVGLYPLTTVGLGALFLRERLARSQYAGVAAAVAAVVLVNI